MDFEQELWTDHPHAMDPDLDRPRTILGHNRQCPDNQTNNDYLNNTDIKNIENMKICTLNTRGLNNDSKRLAIFQWIKDNRFDIIGLQETYCTKDFENHFKKYWPGEIIHSYTDSKHSRGVCLLVKKGFMGNIVNSHTDIFGRKVLVNLKINDEFYTVANFYAPNSDSDRKIFLKKCITWIKQHAYNMNHLIIMGDFNTVESPNDRTSRNIDGTSMFLKTFKHDLGIVDSWKKLNPNSLQYTWRDPSFCLNQSRIDYIFTSTVLGNFISQSKIMPAPRTDHNAVSTHLKNMNRERGPSYWKLNVSILDDIEYVKGIENVYHETCLEYETALPADILWDLLKTRFKAFSIKYSKQKATQKRKEIEDIKKCIDEIDKNITDPKYSEERKGLQDKLNSFYVEKAFGNYIRSRAKWIEEGEVSSKYFLSLEKRRQTYNRIDKLQGNFGQDIESDNEILNECKDFYSDLYRSRLPQKEEINNFLDSIGFTHILSDHDKEICDQPIAENEIIDVLKKLKKNKSPGMDGLPVEFYLKFWSLLKSMFQKVLENAFENGIMPYTMRTSMISLMFKKGDRKLLQNYRPISLSCTDYKILAFVLNNRIMKVIDAVVSSDQAGFIRKRFGGQNIRLIEDVLEYTKRFKINGAIIFLDFKKAFDSLEWTFMIEILKRYNFGQNFIQWVQTLYCKPVAFVKNNGWISEEFSQSRGIRQGCPISALLFILSIEALALKIKQSNTYPALQLNLDNRMVDLRIKQFADDTTLFIKALEKIESALSLVHQFGKVSGLLLNTEKTEGILLGDPSDYIQESHGIKWRQNGAKYLGIYMGYNKEFCMQKNWVDKIEKFQRILDNWRKRNLTLFGKVVIIKTLGLSNIVYTAKHTETPPGVIKQVESIIFQFIWNKVDRIKRTILYADIEEGGLRVTDPGSFFEALKCTWIQKIIDKPNESWSALAHYYFEKLGGPDILFNTNFTELCQYPNLEKVPVFYQQAILSYNKCKKTADLRILTLEQLMKEQIWGNILFSIGKKNKFKTLYFGPWISAGIRFICDLQFTNGKLDTNFLLENVQDKRNIYSEIFQLMKVLQPYKNLFIGLNHYPFMNPRAVVISPIYKVSECQDYYNKLIECKKQVHIIEKWSNILGINIDENLRSQTFRTRVKNMPEKKLAEFNFKVLHYILSNGYLVSKWNSNISSSCELCGVDNTIYHMLLACSLAKHVWKQYENIFGITLSEGDIILGFKKDVSFNYTVTFLSYQLYKFWLLNSATNSRRSVDNLIRQIQSDILTKVRVLGSLNKTNLALIDDLEKISLNINV